ncbi:958_t:CDS:2 [Funneliformis caledonium]|uniref:958_t:CDS:1 n=1 Tax=Funneliformis caledonium TaxID=1117310 RepID=A0A9N9F9T7_9GLOM|nr:958_t:CDS:2 [Funneliformis caledonium]
MPQQKRKASTIASAKIAEEAGSGRKRKSDTKEQRTSSTKETDNDKDIVKGDDIEQNVSDDKVKESVKEQPGNKRRKKSEEQESNSQEIQEQKSGNGIIVDKINEVKSEQEPQGHDLIKPHEHDQMLVDEYNKNVETTEQRQKEDIDLSKGEQAVDIKQVQIETKKELGKKMASNTIEKGHICFLYRPKINVENPDSIDDVQRLFMILIPYMVRPSVSEEPIPSYFHQIIDNKQFDANEPIPGKTRVISIGKKKLPEIEKHAKFWAYVDKAFTNLDDLKDFTNGRKYQTATRGERTLSSCRLLGRGVYNIVEHKGHTHLAYVLEFPEEPNEVQKEFNINKEGSYVINYEKVTYPTHLLDKFRGRRFISLVSSELLDYDGAELLFIGAKEDITGELGEAGKELEELADFEIKEIAPLAAERVIYDELHLEKDALPSEPLHGLWK